MSVQKLVAEADKLLERSKFAEAILKLKSALQTEPLNQLVATKLANAFINTQDLEEAAKVYSTLAKRLSDAGKSQVAVAIFKQALELIPEDVALRVRFAQECESVGKLGDAYLQAQTALQHFIPRKKYFDAASLMPLICRAQPRDESIKSYWIEMIQMSQAETKLPHLLVALCGPPGLASTEFAVGGDPALLSQSLYDGLKKLVPYFPRDPKVAYAVAWSAYRRGRIKDFYHYLHECLRRDPDFCLAIILFARVLAEEKRLNEAYFLFKHYKERMPTDKTVDMLALNRQMESFIEKNGWVNFTEASQDALDPTDFLASITGEKKSEDGGQAQEKPKTQQEKIAAAKEMAQAANVDLPPAEIELRLDSGNADNEVMLTDGKTLTGTMAPSNPLPTTPAAAPEPTQQTTVQALPSAAPPVPVAAPPAVAVPAAASPLAEPDLGHEEVVEFTGLIQIKAGDLSPPPESPPAEAASAGHVEEAAAEAAEAPPVEEAVEEPPVAEAKPRVLFNPLVNSAVDPDLPPPPAPPEREDRTAMFSPIELLDAVKVKKGTDNADVKSRSVIVESKPPPPPSTAPARATGIEVAEADKLKWKQLNVEGEKTIVFSPVEAVRAGADSRRPRDSAVPPPKAEQSPPAAPPPSTAPPVAELPPASEDPPAPLSSSEEPTRVGMIVAPAAAPPPEAEVIAELDMERTREVPRPVMAAQPAEPVEVVQEQPTPAPTPSAPNLAAGPNIAFMPIPTPPPPAAPKVEAEAVDMGDDLLEGATSIITRPTSADKTEHLLKEIKREFHDKPGTKQTAELMLRKADRYTAKRNYYLARKALRHAQALGADEIIVKERLRTIRKLEFPDALYNTISSDRAAKVDTAEVLDRLEQEFGLHQESTEEGEISVVVESQIEEILQSHDPRTILDFGVGLHEMGMYRLAEQLYQRVITESPDFAFDAYYLSATAKLARKDYAGAASILKRLSADMGRSETDKIQIYYALGETFEKMRQLDRSKELFRKVAELDADYRNVRQKLED